MTVLKDFFVVFLLCRHPPSARREEPSRVVVRYVVVSSVILLVLFIDLMWWCMVTEGSQITNKMENMLIYLVHHEMDIIIHKQIMIVQLNAEVEDRRVRDSSRMENWSQNKLVSISTHKTANIGNKMTEDAKRKKIVNIGIGILIQTMWNLWRMAIAYAKFTLCCLPYCTMPCIILPQCADDSIFCHIVTCWFPIFANFACDLWSEQS